MPPIRPELLDELLKNYQKPDDLLGQDGLLQQITKALVERALDGELTHHLGYERHDPAGDNSGNSRNGTTPKTLSGKRGQVQIDVPRDRTSEFEPQLVRKGPGAATLQGTAEFHSLGGRGEVSSHFR